MGVLTRLLWIKDENSLRYPHQGREALELIPAETGREAGYTLPNLVLKCFCSPGSIPEEDGGKLFNSCTVFGPDGQLILKHRKVCIY